MKLSVGKRFVNKDAMKLAVSELCVIDNFSTKTLASSTKRLRMACSEESCGWFVYATSVSDSSSEFSSLTDKKVSSMEWKRFLVITVITVSV